MFVEHKNLNADVKADPFSLDSLIAWLEKQPGDKTYCWADSWKCLFAQYGEVIGIGKSHGAYNAFHKALIARGVDNNKFELHIACTIPHTFGAALSRARALKAAQS